MPGSVFATAASPDGSTVFVTGASSGASGEGEDYATVAYDASSGRQLWTARYDHGLVDSPVGIVVSRDGTRVFVPGRTSARQQQADWDYATVAYDAATGSKLWARRYNGPANDADDAWALGMSPDGSTVVVTGGSIGSEGSGDYATVAYAAATGERLWVKRYDGPGKFIDSASALAMSPDGSKVFVTGTSAREPGQLASIFDFATIAYSVATGAKLWVARYEGPRAGNNAKALVVSPDGARVYVTGGSRSRPDTYCNVDYATVAYATSTGESLWVRRYDYNGGNDDPAGIAVSPNGAKVFVTGWSQSLFTRVFAYATLAYSTP